MSGLPVAYSELLQLQSLGIAPSNISFSTVTIQSDRYICVREKVGENSQVAIVDVRNPTSVVRNPIAADSAIVNPSSMIVALKHTNTLQIFDLENKKKLADYVSPEDVIFWKWVSDSRIALATRKSVFHWDIKENTTTTPALVFDLHTSLMNSQLINYQIDSTGKWCILIGISAVDNKITGAMQLFSVERNVIQPIAGNAACFTEIKLDENPNPSNIFVFTNRDDSGACKVHVIEVGGTPAGNQPFRKRTVDMVVPPDAIGDFPISVHSGGSNSGIFFIMTKAGYFYLYEIESMICVYATKVSQDVVFASINSDPFGLIAINRLGVVFSLRMDGPNVLNFTRAKNIEPVGMKIAERCGFPGGEQATFMKFNDLLMKGQFEAAARLAALSPGGILRNQETIKRLQALPAQPGVTSPLLHYFSVLLESTKLNRMETIELCKPVLAQKKVPLVEKWINEEKLDYSEELGDLVHMADIKLALKIYQKSSSHSKALQCLAETGQFPAIIQYAKEYGLSPDYPSILTSVLKVNPDAGVEFAKQLVNSQPPLYDDISRLFDCFAQFNLVPQGTNFLLDALKENKPEHAELQTRLLEMNLVTAPQVAEAIFNNKLFSYYDRSNIARLCEQAGLLHRALEHYTDIYDIKRSIINTHMLNPEWLINYFGTLNLDDSLECLSLLIDTNPMQNTKLCVAIAVKYNQQLGTMNLIHIFESKNNYEGLFLYLTQVINQSEDGEVHFKFIQAACKIGQFKELERICRESHFYDPETVINYLKEVRLTDYLPLIIVCDKHNHVNELILHLHKHNALKYIEMYVQKVNPGRLPTVVGALLDYNVGDEFVRNMLVSVPDNFDMSDLVSEVSKRNRMNLLIPVLEQRIYQGSTDVGTHSALAMVYVDINQFPERFLRENQYYDSNSVGKFCESRDPKLAFVAYERGHCTDSIIELCYRCSLYKHLARYAVARKDLSLWSRLLSETEEHRRPLIDQVVQAALIESRDPEEVSIAVKGFMDANLPSELMGLLEHLVTNNPQFSQHKNLQNLLILTAIKAEPSKVVEYINRMEHFDYNEVSSIAIENGLFEEAFSIYKKFDAHESAVSVLVNNIKSLDRGYEYAERINKPKVWGIIAHAQLDAGQSKNAITSYIRANDFTNYIRVVDVARNDRDYVSLKSYLQLAKKVINNSFVDTQYVFVLAALEEFQELEEFISKTTHINLVQVGDTCYQDKLYAASKILFTAANHYPKLTLALLKLGDYSSAVETAKKANNLSTWREVCFSCIDASEFKFAKVCALQLVINPDELNRLIQKYESLGFFKELVESLESSIGSDRAHSALFTELAIAYSKYDWPKLRDHITLFYTRINIPKLVKAAESSHQWSSLALLYEKYDDHDKFIETVIKHPVECYRDIQFRDIAGKATSPTILFSAIDFLFECDPANLSPFLISVSYKMDHTRVIKCLKDKGCLWLIVSYLQHVQKNNISSINNAINQLYIEEGMDEDLLQSVTKYTNCDLIALAEQLEKSQNIEFRRVANHIYKQCNRFNKAIETAKSDYLYLDCIKFAGESKDKNQAVELLDFFAKNKMSEYLVPLTYHCYDLLPPDQVLEACWLNGMQDFAFPYMINKMHEFSQKLETMTGFVTDQKKDDQEKEKPSIRMQPQLMLTGRAAGGFSSNFAAPPSANTGGFRQL